MPLECDQRRLAGDVDDRTTLADAHHLTRCVFCDQQSAACIDGDNFVEDGDVGVHRRRDLAAEAAAIDDTPQIEALERIANLVFRGEIEGHGAAARLPGDRVERLARASGRDDLGIRPHQVAHGGAANAAAAARHQDPSSLKIRHGFPLFKLASRRPRRSILRTAAHCTVFDPCGQLMRSSAAASSAYAAASETLSPALLKRWQARSGMLMAMRSPGRTMRPRLSRMIRFSPRWLACMKVSLPRSSTIAAC